MLNEYPIILFKFKIEKHYTNQLNHYGIRTFTTENLWNQNFDVDLLKKDNQKKQQTERKQIGLKSE